MDNIKDEWDIDNAEWFACSVFYWNKDKTKLRIYIPSKRDLQETQKIGISKEAKEINDIILEAAPNKTVELEFKDDYMIRLKKFLGV